MSMYPHRGLPPSAGRLNELLDQIRTEFDNQARINDGYEQQSMFSTRSDCCFTPCFLLIFSARILLKYIRPA
jgi:hypothetical protein